MGSDNGKVGNVELVLTSIQRSMLEGLFLNQTGDYKKLRKLWKLEDELELDDKQRIACGWTTNSQGEFVKIEEPDVELTFVLSLAGAKTLRSLALTETDGWRNSKPLRRLLVSLDEQTNIVGNLD